jgi:hypothetical protein
VEFGNVLKESLPTGHERSISATLLKSIRQLGPEGLDFLRLASVLAVAPIQVKFVSEIFEISREPKGSAARTLRRIARTAVFRKLFVYANASETAKSRSTKAVDQAAALSLCERAGDDALMVHTLISRTMRFQFPSDKRTQSLRSGALEALTRRLRIVADIREHSKIALELPHARHLITNDLQTQAQTGLAALVALHDYERADYASARRLQEQVLLTRRRHLLAITLRVR